MTVICCLTLLSGCGGTHNAAKPPPPATAIGTAPPAQGSGEKVTATPNRAAPAITAATAPPTGTGIPAATAAPSLVDIASGKVLVQAQCAACHALADAGIAASPQMIGPALDRVGATHSGAWLARVLLDACAGSTKQGSAVRCATVHADVAQLSPGERAQVVAYLQTLR